MEISVVEDTYDYEYRGFVMSRVNSESYAGIEHIVYDTGEPLAVDDPEIQKGINILNFTKRKNNP